MSKGSSLNTMFNGPIINIDNPVDRLMEIRLGNRKRDKCLRTGVCVRVIEEDNQNYFLIDTGSDKLLQVGQGTMVTRISA